MTHLCPKTG
nr:unnamed protein product [Callosobruchus chinensis]